MSANRTKVFVYGSLLRGLHNNGRLATARFIGPAVTAARYVLLDLGAFPGAVRHRRTFATTPGHRLNGEVYLVDDATLALLDQMEGHPRVYRRRAVQTSIGRAFMYEYRRHTARQVDPKIVAGGCWRAYLRQRSQPGHRATAGFFPEFFPTALDTDTARG